MSLLWVLLAKKGDLLALQKRRDIYRYVGRFPGMHLREIARALDMTPNHVKYHLQHLEKHGLVSSKKEDGYWRFWPREEGSTGHRDQVDARDKKRLSILRRPVPLHVVLLLLDRGRATHRDLLAEVDVSHSTLHYHLKKMTDAQILDSEKDGRERFYWIPEPDGLLELVLKYQPPNTIVHKFLDAWEQLEIR